VEETEAHVHIYMWKIIYKHKHPHPHCPPLTQYIENHNDDDASSQNKGDTHRPRTRTLFLTPRPTWPSPTGPHRTSLWKQVWVTHYFGCGKWENARLSQSDNRRRLLAA